MTHDMKLEDNRVGPERESDCRESRVADLAEAFGDLLELIRAHPDEDRKLFLEAVQVLTSTSDTEEQAEAQATIREILEDQVCQTLIAFRMEMPHGQESDVADPDLRRWTEHVGGTVKRLREEASLTQEQLAVRAGLTQSHISRIETGKHSPSYRTVSRIADALGVDRTVIDCTE